MRQYIIVAIIGLIIMFSCSDDTKLYQVGEDFIESDDKLFQIDTMTINTATIIADSLITSDTERILVGSLQDNVFGNLTSQSYLKYITSDYSIDDDAEFDSIALVLFYDRYYYGDTTATQNYSVYEITETFEPNDEEDELYFYNTSYLSYDADNLLGELSFTPHPYKKDSIIIPMSYDFGKNIFDKIQENDIEDLNDLEKEFRGLTIIPDDTNTVLGFKYSSGSTYNYSSLRFYYTIEDEDDDENDYVYEFTISDSSNSMFNSITSDKSNTAISSLEDSEDILLTSETSNKAYLQSGTGVAMRVEIPHSRTLNALENDGTTLEAVLQMFPDQNSYDDFDYIDSLAVFVIDSQNRVIQQLTSFSGDAVYAQLNSDNSEFNNEVYYETDISFYIETLQTSDYELDYALRFEFPENTNSIQHLLINDSENPDNTDLKMKLQLTYLTF